MWLEVTASSCRMGMIMPQGMRIKAAVVEEKEPRCYQKNVEK